MINISLTHFIVTCDRKWDYTDTILQWEWALLELLKQKANNGKDLDKRSLPKTIILDVSGRYKQTVDWLSN